MGRAAPLLESAAGQWTKNSSGCLNGSTPALAIPFPCKGTPAEGYPWNWSIYRWLEGENAYWRRPFLGQAAAQLAQFVDALHRIDATGGHSPDSITFFAVYHWQMRAFRHP